MDSKEQNKKERSSGSFPCATYNCPKSHHVAESQFGGEGEWGSAVDVVPVDDDAMFDELPDGDFISAFDRAEQIGF